MPAFGVIGGSHRWALALAAGHLRIIAISGVPVWAVTATGIGGPSLGLDQPKGLWVALYYSTFLAVLMIACAIHLRIGKHTEVPDRLEPENRFPKGR